MRKFKITVENGLGDQATVDMNVREDRSPSQYSGPAILAAMKVIPNEKPWKVVLFDEVCQ